MRNRRCPYCARPLDADGVEDSEEHVFVEALGGRATIRACQDCNSRIGHTIEGKLLAPHALLALQYAIAHGVGPVLDVTDEGGQGFRTDLGTGDYRAVRVVVSETRDGDTLKRTLSGPPEQVKPILEGMAKKYPGIDVGALMASATERTSEELSTSIEVDVHLEARLAAKVALAAATRCLGDDFIDTSLAAELRSIIDGNSPPLIEPAEKIEPALEKAGIVVGDGERQSVLVALGADKAAPARTVVCVRMLGRSLPAGHVLVVHEPCPQPMVLLHEGPSGDPECLDAYIQNHVIPTHDS